MHYLLLTSLLVGFLFLPAAAQTKRGARPKPPKQVFTIKGDANYSAPPKAKVEELTFGTVIEKYVSDYDLNSDGTGTETRTTQQRCVSVTCVERLGSASQVFNGDLQKVKVLVAYILKADGTQVKVPAAGIIDRPTDQTEAAPGFSSLRELEIKFDGLAVGDAVYLKIEVRTIRPTFEGRFDALELFHLVYDWKSIEINVSAPANFPLFIDSAGLEGGKLPDENGRSRWRYKKLDVARLPLEPAMQVVTETSPRFALTTFRDAEALGAVFWEGVKKKAVITPEIQALADEITKDAATPSARASAIYDWVNKNIRYLSIVLDRGGWIPHSSSEIVKNGYGDCKDYTTIIHTLLKAKGIDSVPVLIRSDIGDWFPSVPTADYFNHAILYIPSLNLFADATAANTRLGLVNQTLVGKRAVLAGEKTGIIQLPKDNPDDNQILSDMRLEFSDNGSLKARTKNTFVGRSEILFRPIFTSAVVKSDSETFVRALLAYYGLDGVGNIVSVGNPHNVGEPFNVEVESRLANFTTFAPKGRLEIPPGLNMISMGSMEAFASTESRKTSIRVGATTVREKIGINLPSTVKALAPPPPVDFSNAVGSFRAASEIKDGSVRYTRELIIKKDVVEPADYPLLKALIKKLAEASVIGVEYSADPSLLRAKSKELRASGVKRKGADVSSLVDDAIESALPKEFTPTEVRRLEKKLTVQPEDVETRLQLINYYSIYGPRKTNRSETTSVRHRIWLIERHPEIEDSKFFGFSTQELSKASIELLKNAWLAKVAAQKGSMTVRINAINSLKEYAPEAASALAEEGAKLDAQNYQVLMLVAEINSADLKKERSGKTEDAARKVLDYGGRALVLLKKERSDERDAERAEILKTLCHAAIQVGDLDAAESFARELILDFGQSADARIYDEAAHIGNTTLGLVEIRRNNTAKAAGHLMASIRAPLRMEYNNLGRIETSLAKELYAKGEKAAVVEFLKLCLTVPNFKVYPESYADEIYALKLWIGQIEKGTTPNFDFDAPESRVPLSKAVIRPDVKISRRP